MKKLIYLACLLISFGAFAQQEEPESNNQPIIIGERSSERMNTLAKGFGYGTHGIYFGLTSGYSQAKNKDILSFGVKLAYVADTKFEIGLAFEALHSENGIAYNNDDPLFLTAGLAGLHLEPILFGRKTVHLSFPIFFGAGPAFLYDQDNFTHQGPSPDPVFPPDPIDEIVYEDVEPILMAQPGVNVVLNIARFLQLEVGGKYRITNDLNFSNGNFGNLNAPMASIGIKVGYFDFGR